MPLFHVPYCMLQVAKTAREQFCHVEVILGTIHMVHSTYDRFFVLVGLCYAIPVSDEAHYTRLHSSTKFSFREFNGVLFDRTSR